MNQPMKMRVQHCLQEAAPLIESGEWRNAFEALANENRINPDENLEKVMIDILLRATATSDAPGRVKPAKAVARDEISSAPSADSILPEISASELSASVLKEAINDHGHLIVRNLLSPEVAEGFCCTINEAMTARMEVSDPEAPGATNGPWYYASPHFPGKHGAFSAGDYSETHGLSGSLKVPDSPRGAFQVLELFRDLNLKDVLEDYFGEPAVIATKKWVFRAIAPLEIKSAERWGAGSGWHQDGQFMGGVDTSALNMWIALSDCGDSSTSPGIALIPRRFKEILEFGTGGAKMNWTVGRGVIEELIKETPLIRPFFAAGDAIFFDHLSLHSTGHTAGQNQKRFALESWFYGASGSSGNFAMPLY